MQNKKTVQSSTKIAVIDENAKDKIYMKGVGVVNGISEMWEYIQYLEGKVSELETNNAKLRKKL